MEQTGGAAASLGFVHTFGIVWAFLKKPFGCTRSCYKPKQRAQAHSSLFVLLWLLAGQAAQEDLSSLSETWLGWLPPTHLSRLFSSPISLRTMR